jgi:hypothetical protein
MAKDQSLASGQNGQAPKESLLMALKAMDEAFRGSDLIVTDTLSGQDHVAIHVAIDTDRTEDGSVSAEGIFIYRIAEARIAEYWLQPGVPDLSVTPSPLFGGVAS